MAEFKDIKSALKKSQAILQRASTDAANRAMGKTQTQMLQIVTDATGLNKKKAKGRMSFVKANVRRPVSAINYGVKFGVNYHDLRTRLTKLKTFKGVKLGVKSAPFKSSYSLVPGAFRVKGKYSGKDVVIGRKDAFTGSGVAQTYSNSKAKRLPTMSLKFYGLEPFLNTHVGRLKQYATQEFKRILPGRIAYYGTPKAKASQE